MEKTIEIKWGTSKGRDTYGYTTCTLREDGKRMAYCNGGGYDLRGTVIGKYVQKRYTDRLKALPSNRGSGDKNHHTYQDGDSVSTDGACGESSMLRIMEAIGLNLRTVARYKNLEVYILNDSREA